MVKAFSIVVFCLCCLTTAVTLYTGKMFVHMITVDSEGWGSKFFGLLAGPIIIVSILLLAASIVLYRIAARRLDLVSIYASIATLALAILAWILVEPLRQWIIFRK
jgi:hypothetical protein